MMYFNGIAYNDLAEPPTMIFRKAPTFTVGSSGWLEPGYPRPGLRCQVAG
jgi:hypothetical protein